MKKSKYVIEESLMVVKIKRINKNIKGFKNKVVELTDEEVKKKIEEYKAKGISIEKYHQEKFDDEIVFIQDVEIKDYKALRDRLNKCRNMVEKKCKEYIQSGEIYYIRNRLYTFDTKFDVFGTLLNYANFIGGGTIITFPTLLYFVECVGNSYDTFLVLEELRKRRIYVHFLDCNRCTGIPDIAVNVDLEYLDILINEYFLEDLLRKMYKEGQLSYDECREYGMSEEEYEIYDPNNDTFEMYIVED